MPRKIPASRFPTGAKDDYAEALKRALQLCFRRLGEQLFAIPELQLADAVELDPLQQAIENVRTANEQLKQTSEQMRRQLAGAQAATAFQSARAHWKQLDTQLQQATAQVARSVSRIAERSTQRQIDAAFSNRRLAVVLNQPLFGDLQAEVDRFSRENALLITDLGEKALRDLEILTQDVVSRGAGAEELASLLEKHLGIAERRAKTIAQNQVSRLNSQLHRLRLQAALSIGYRWVHSGNPNPRIAHKLMDGQIRSYDDDPLPGEEVGCGCGMIPLFEGDGNVPPAPPSTGGSGNEPPGSNVLSPPSGSPDDFEAHKRHILAFLAEHEERDPTKEGRRARRQRIPEFKKGLRPLDVPGYAELISKIEIATESLIATPEKNYVVQRNALEGLMAELLLAYKYETTGHRMVSLGLQTSGHEGDIDVLAVSPTHINLVESKAGENARARDIRKKTIPHFTKIYGQFAEQLLTDQERQRPRRLVLYLPKALYNMPPSEHQEFMGEILESFDEVLIIRNIDEITLEM